MENDDDDDRIRPEKITNAMDSPSTIPTSVAHETMLIARSRAFAQLTSDGHRRRGVVTMIEIRARSTSTVSFSV